MINERLENWLVISPKHHSTNTINEKPEINYFKPKLEMK
jgi:hypothetical protein